MAAMGDGAAKFGDTLRLGTKYDYLPEINCAGTKNKHEWVEAYISKMGGDGKNVFVNIKFRYCGDKEDEIKDLIFPNDRLLPCGSQIKMRQNCKSRVFVK